MDHIHGGDIIRLVHTESEGFLAANLKYELENPEIYLEKYTGDFENEVNNVNSLWEIEIDR